MVICGASVASTLLAASPSTSGLWCLHVTAQHILQRVAHCASHSRTRSTAGSVSGLRGVARTSCFGQVHNPGYSTYKRLHACASWIAWAHGVHKCAGVRVYSCPSPQPGLEGHATCAQPADTDREPHAWHVPYMLTAIYLPSIQSV